MIETGMVHDNAEYGMFFNKLRVLIGKFICANISERLISTIVNFTSPTILTSNWINSISRRETLSYAAPSNTSLIL